MGQASEEFQKARSCCGSAGGGGPERFYEFESVEA